MGKILLFRFTYIYILFVIYFLINLETERYYLKFIKITDSFYVSSAFIDKRINSVRILFASTIYINISMNLKIDNFNIYSYKNVIYDDCISFDSDFDLKYGNLIIPYNEYPHFVYVNNNKIKIIKNEKEKYFLSVCITTMYNYNAKLMFQQLIEIYLHLGVDHFTIYYSSSSIDILNIIKKYESKNIIKIIYWERNNNTLRMRNYGQYLKTNDCLYRYLNLSKYIINTDLDEILLPLKFNTLIEYIHYINKNNNFITMILFSSKMFIKNETLDREVKNRRKDYLNLHKISDVNIFSIKKCCYSHELYRKYIVHIADMIALHTHKAWKGNIKIYHVPYIDGYSRHTRRFAYFMKNKYCKNVEYDYNLSKILPFLNEKYQRWQNA